MTTADEALRVLCEGEPWDLDRRTEHLLVAVADAMATAWRPSTAGLTPKARARTGYLLTVLRDGLSRSDAAGWSSWLAELRRGLTVGAVDTGDDVAREWGLERGLDVLRVRRVVRMG